MIQIQFKEMKGKRKYGIIILHYDFIHTYFIKVYETFHQMYIFYDRMVQIELGIEEDGNFEE